jgi:hypothetical protein
MVWSWVVLRELMQYSVVMRSAWWRTRIHRTGERQPADGIALTPHYVGLVHSWSKQATKRILVDWELWLQRVHASSEQRAANRGPVGVVLASSWKVTVWLQPHKGAHRGSLERKGFWKPQCACSTKTICSTASVA